MRKSGIKLNMDMAYLSFLQGTADAISHGGVEEYVTKIDIVFPTSIPSPPEGIFSLDYDDKKVDIKVSILNSAQEDPALNAARNLNIGASGSGLEMIPFQAFTDNRGKYPAVMATLIFPWRVASWVDYGPGGRITSESEREEFQITGFPKSKEKILAILLINRLIKSFDRPDLKSLSYDDISVFLETYFRKGSRTPLISKINALTSQGAYKEAVYDFIVPNYEEEDVNASLLDFQKLYAGKEICTEEELKLAVSGAIENVLKHNVERRRWIEPFWDGQRKFKHKGEEIIVPRSPKSEPKIQPTLHVILDMALMPLGIQVIRESDEGIGSLDFRFLFTTKSGSPLSVGVEFKIAHHGEIKKGIEKQLPAYLDAIRSSNGIYVIMWFKDSKYFKKPKKYDKEQMENWIVDEATKISRESDKSITAAMLDASIRPSASKL